MSELVAHRDTYRVISQLSQTIGVLRQTLYKIFIWSVSALACRLKSTGGSEKSPSHEKYFLGAKSTSEK